MARRASSTGPLEGQWQDILLRTFSVLVGAVASLFHSGGCQTLIGGGVYQYFTAGNTIKYMDVLPSLVERYNEDVHRCTVMAPWDVNAAKKAEMWRRLYDNLASKARLQGSLRVVQWTEDVFQIRSVVPGPLLM